MSTITYRVIEHDGGYAYKAGDTFSETFASHDEALRAARIAAQEQQIPGSPETIEYQDSLGRRHVETADGADRPGTAVDG
ncbi:DUF2188 domain-containing protein [Methylobacterium haplocladii]|uniref:DUF2188 domain-containing protein n=1 Tax=Methylobacterium haplocladii TaxID=1176176 RepID=A0A512IS23_9HYPH|nr:DUF2188 domain-containing protein [Methylobacterium haplocladii]GEP00483.1 hypothetical protein MHA02_28700 [Methylobacterium haplocladii]GJD82496.1 hypothetical protein HPGCJGGD_0352 [Methylobacterium haplocladii]GLS59580.1 hypothetical protein GCM10007887_22490 [Methylobacterium haplocladii]